MRVVIQDPLDRENGRLARLRAHQLMRAWHDRRRGRPSTEHEQKSRTFLDAVRHFYVRQLVRLRAARSVSHPTVDESTKVSLAQRLSMTFDS